MSFTDNFLKALQEKGVSTTNIAGGTTPSASSESSDTHSGKSSYTSNFLSALEKRNNMTISERAAERAQTLLKEQRDRARTPEGIFHNAAKNRTGLTTSGGYYSRPAFGSASEKLYSNLTALEPVLTQKRSTVETAQTSLQQARTDLNTMQGHLDQARAAYDADPTEANANSYNQIVSAYNLAYDACTSAYDAYSAAYDDYRTYENRMVDALAMYQIYNDQQQKDFDSWKGTIRESGAVQEDIARIEEELAKARENKRDLENLQKQYKEQLGESYTNRLAGYEKQITQLESALELAQEELGWSQYYYYAGMTDASDFAEKSQYVSTANGGGRSWLDIMLDRYDSDNSGWDDPLYEYINGNEEAGAYISNAAASGYGSDNAIGAVYGRATESKTESQQMDEQEVATFNYLYATQGKEAAYAYYNYLLEDLNYRQRQADEAYWAEYAAKHPVGSSVLSVAMSPAKGLSYIGQLTDYLQDGKIDQNAAYNKFSYAPNAMRGQVAQQIEASGKWGKVGSFAYQTGLSMADFLLNTAIAGGNEAATLAIMGSGAAADATISAKDRGLTDTQSFLLGTIAGAAEIITEKVSIEALLNPDLLKNGAAKYVLKNMLSEGFEEVGSDLINLIADIIIAKDQSEWQESIDYYTAQGKTKVGAFALAVADQVPTMVLDFLGGAISGGILSGVNAGIHVNYTNQMGNDLNGMNLNAEDIQAFIETGLESDPETASYQLAVEMQEKIGAGKELTGYDLARLWQANMQAIQEEESAGKLPDDTIVEGEQTEMASGEDVEPGGLSLPTAEDSRIAIEDGQAGTVADNVTDGALQLPSLERNTQTHDAARSADAPLSIADQLRREQAQNGGIKNESTYERTAGSAEIRPAESLYAPGGAGIPNGSAEWNDGTGTAEQAGVLAGSAEQRRSAWTDRSRATVVRQNYARSLRLEKVSSLDLGLQNGTEARNIQIMPKESWDAEMAQLADRIYNETGKDVTYVMGRIQIRGSGGTVSYARGVITGDQIIVQADNLRIPMEQIADHEAYHAKADFTDGRLNGEIRRYIIETFSEEQFYRVLDKYIEGLRGVIDVNETRSGAEFEAAIRQIEEEIFADAYAGINAFGAGADQFTDAVNERMDQLYMGKIRNQDNGTEVSTGPPGNDRYSIETLPDGQKYVRADRQVIFGNDPDSWSGQVEDYINGRIRRGQDVALIAENGDILTITPTTAGKLADNHTGRGTTMSDEDFYVKSNAAVHIDELSQISARGQTKKDLGSRHGEFASGGWNYRTAFFQDFDGRYYKLQISVAQNEQGNIVYNIGRIEERSSPTIYGSSAKGGALSGKTSFGESVPQADRTVKQRFSYAGENANNADLDALERAKEMRSAGVADETIRQQTGWHTGMDGKWRWEIDDSGMRYDSSGDFRGAESAKWAMEDYESARDELWSHADMDTLDKVRAYNRADIAGDLATKGDLYDELINGAHAYYFDQYVEAMTRAKEARNAPAGGTLQDYIDHPTLFEAYPQLRNVTLKFERMDGGIMGYYSQAENEIVLNTELRSAAEDTLVHEIQHAIQDAEGFARGSNEEYWKQRQSGDNAVRVYDTKIQAAEKKVSEIMSQLPENVAEQFRQWSAMDDSSSQAMELAQELGDGPYADLFNDYFMTTWGLDEMRSYNHKRGSKDLYRNTAGEIEARDVTARRNLAPEQRRSQEPARGDSNTVFAEEFDDQSFAEMDAEYGPQMQSYFGPDVATEEIDSNIQRVAQMDPVTQISGEEFAKGAKDLTTQVEEFFAQIGNSAYNEQLGDVVLDRRGIKSDIAHGVGRKKAAAFAAVPDVIEQGLVVDYQQNWKGRGYDTAVVAAPITIGADEHLAAVVLTRSNQTNRFYVHEVLTTKDGAMPFKTGTLNKGAPGGDAPSVLSILDGIRSVKNQNEVADRFSVDDAGNLAAIGDLQAELHQLQSQRRSILEADADYAAAAENLRHANTFTEKVAARKAMAAAAANIDTAAIDQRISDLNKQINEIRNHEIRQHQEDQKKYSGSKTAGYSTMPDTRLKDLDRDYMEAVRSGDRSRMAELVEQAAEAAMPASAVRDKSGRLLKTYHHTGNRFTAFDRNMARTGTEMDGFFFAPDPDSTSEYGSNMITAYLNITNLAMDPKLDRKFNDSGTLLREKLAYQGYDGMARTENGEIYEYMTFDPEQIKSADPVVYDDRGRVVPLSERFDFQNRDIRFSVDDEQTGSATTNTGVQQRINDLMNQYQEAVARGDQAQVEEISGKLTQALRKTMPQKKAAEQRDTTAARKKTRPVAESLPLIAKKDLRNTVLNLFSTPDGQRAEIGTMIDSYTDRLLKNGSLTEDDRQTFFDRMYDAGVMVMPAEEYNAFARSHIVDGRIYVSDSVKADFGDDWADIRRRAFAAGVYLVNDKTAAGIDQWNATLSAEDMLPGLFDSEETDERTILERIIQVAEEGKDERLSLAEYTRRLSQQEGISEDEFLDNMERQLDWALRTFAEKASLEVHLRDRTGRKIAQERERGAERLTRQRARETQRRADERQARKDSSRRARERRELRELQQRTMKQLQWLSKNRNRAPEELRATWDEVLGDIDIYAISAADEMRWSEKHNATWQDLAQMYKDAMKNDPNFLPSKELERIVARLDTTKIADMDLGALQDLYKAAIGLRTEFYNRNNVINDDMHRLFAEVYTDAKQEIENAPGKYTGKTTDKLFNLQQLTAMNVMQRMGGWDPDGAFFSMAKQLERGERDVRAYKVKASRMLESFLTENADWVKTADGQGKDAVWYKIEIPELIALELGKKPEFGKTITVWMTPAQKVHMYLESKNVDNLHHMTGGRTFADKELYSAGKRSEAFAQGTTVRMAPETVKAIVSDLTPQELELAGLLERYYNSFATSEINRVSNALYGYDKAMGKNYAPIYTNRNYTKTEFGVFDTTAEGVGNLKGRQYAVNPSYNIGAFDAFEKHMDQTGRFVGMAIPTRNWTTLMNWRVSNNSTADVITHKWGEEGKSYITDLITTLQEGGGSQSDVVQSGIEKLRSNYISAVFGANPSIVLKQLGSIPLAAAYLDAKNFPSVRQIAGIDRQLIRQYTQDLEWRTMGYSMPETKTLKENPNWTQSNKVANFLVGGGAITAMDGWAASVLWPWTENKVAREFPELSRGTDAQIQNGQSPFYQKVAEEFENAVARSQSTSDEIHQGTLRKSKNPFTQVFTMFRSDSAQTYNVLRQKIGEAQYYARTGADAKTIRTARKAVGTAALSALIGYVWAEAVELLMNLWKHKGKSYRDDDGELTAESIAGEMVSGLVGDIAGIVVGGEELYDFLGGLLTDGTLYGVETMGLEQLNDCAEAMWYAGRGLLDVISDGADILKNGGNLGEYFRSHGNEMLGGVKDIANTAAMYISGFPTDNLEKYLLGGIKWLAPELQAGYEDLLSTPSKTDLSGLNGDALTARVGDIMDNRGIAALEETAQVLAQLYENGEKTAIFGDTPSSVSINGEKRSLSAYQQQTYDKVWASVVSDGLDELVSTSAFSEADEKTRAKMLSNLYTYAAEQAKAELFDDYEMDSGAAKNMAIIASGATIAECITWNTITSEMKSGEKSAELAFWDIPEAAKREIFRCKISDSREDSIAAFDAAGLSFDQFLEAYSMYGQINGEDVKAGMKAVEFSHWVNAQGYTAEQAAVVKDELVYFSMTPASSSRYDDLVGSGMDPDDAYELTGALSELQPEDGTDEVSDLQKWRASVDFSDDVDDQLAALSVVMTDAQFRKAEIANSFGINPDAYVTFLEIKPQYDADGNGSYTQKEIQAAVDGLPGYYTKEQKAVLWQLATGSTSAKNNPYSRNVGQQVLDARAAAKEAAAQEQTGATTDTTDGDSFSQELLNQLLGRG